MKVRILKKLLTEAGFFVVRSGKGSHEIWGNDDGLTFPVPGADGAELKTGTEIAILKAAGLFEVVKQKRSKN
jgi:predicted RNA binding protein YcfA (HicA-like mRNA interferase family)